MGGAAEHAASLGAVMIEGHAASCAAANGIVGGLRGRPVCLAALAPAVQTARGRALRCHVCNEAVIDPAEPSAYLSGCCFWRGLRYPMVDRTASRVVRATLRDHLPRARRGAGGCALLPPVTTALAVPSPDGLQPPGSDAARFLAAAFLLAGAAARSGVAAVFDTSVARVACGLFFFLAVDLLPPGAEGRPLTTGARVLLCPQRLGQPGGATYTRLCYDVRCGITTSDDR